MSRGRVRGTMWQERERADRSARFAPVEVEGVRELVLRHRAVGIAIMNDLEQGRLHIQAGSDLRIDVARALHRRVRQCLNTSRASAEQIERLGLRFLDDAARKRYAEQARAELENLERRMREWGCDIEKALIAAREQPYSWS